MLYSLKFFQLNFYHLQHHHTARQSDQNYRLRMTGIQFPYGRADIGHYQVPFEFIVPHEAPSTVLVPLVGRNSAAVTHMIAVGINVGGGKVHYVHSVPFQVISKVNHPISETMIEDKKDIDWYLLWTTVITNYYLVCTLFSSYYSLLLNYI